MTGFQEAHTLGFPVFCLAFTPSRSRLLIGGGGGATKAGVKNALMYFDVNESQGGLEPLGELLFSKLEDGCMSVAVHPTQKLIVVGVNSPEEETKAGKNLNCRVFMMKSNKFVHVESIKTMETTDPFHHQKITLFNKDGSVLLVGTTEGVCHFYSWPKMTSMFSPIKPGNEINDADICATSPYSVLVTSKKCFLVDIAQKGRIESVDENPQFGKVPCEFRAVRFLNNESFGTIIVACNAKSRKAAFIVRYHRKSQNDWRKDKYVQVANKPITAFSLSSCGTLIGFGSADMSVNVLRTSTFQSILKVKEAHGFPVTALTFSPSSRIIASGSADGTCRIISIPLQTSNRTWTFWRICLLCIVAIIIIILVLLLSMTLSSDEPDL